MPTQAAVSLRLKRLEERLGCRLVERTPRCVPLDGARRELPLRAHPRRSRCSMLGRSVRKAPAAPGSSRTTSGRRIVTLSGHSPPPPSKALIAREREDAYALARCGVDRVGDRRPDRRHARLTHPGRPLGAWHDVDFHLRHFVEAQHVVTVEIALLDSAALKGDLRLHDGAEAEADPAFHLGADDVRVDRHPAIDGADDALDLWLSPVVDGYLGDLRHVGLERFGDRNTAEAALGQRPVPTRLFGREPEHAGMA